MPITIYFQLRRIRILKANKTKENFRKKIIEGVSILIFLEYLLTLPYILMQHLTLQYQLNKAPKIIGGNFQTQKIPIYIGGRNIYNYSSCF